MFNTLPDVKNLQNNIQICFSKLVCFINLDSNRLITKIRYSKLTKLIIKIIIRYYHATVEVEPNFQF